MIATINPATGVMETILDPHSAGEVDERIDECIRARGLLRQTPMPQRQDWLVRVADILDDLAEGLAELLAVEVGTPQRQSLAEVRRCSEFLRTIPSVRSAKVRYEKNGGLVLGVVSSTRPLLSVIEFAAPALLSGETVLLKHASNAPQIAMFLDSLFERGGFPPGSFRILLTPHRELHLVIDDERVSELVIDGSVFARNDLVALAKKLGKPVWVQNADRVIAVVVPSARLDLAVERIVTSFTLNSGQATSALKQVYVHANIQTEFVTALRSRINTLSIENPLSPRADIGPLSTPARLERTISLVNDARMMGAKVTATKAPLPLTGWFFPVTFIENLPNGARLKNETAPGPVLICESFCSLSELVDEKPEWKSQTIVSLWAAADDADKLPADAILKSHVFTNDCPEILAP